MEVRDLIHLLQTRGKPESEVVFTLFGGMEDGEKNHLMIHSEDDVYSVWEEDDGEMTDICFIRLPDCVVGNIIKAYKSGQIIMEDEANDKHD